MTRSEPRKRTLPVGSQGPVLIPSKKRIPIKETYTFPEGIWRSVTKVEETSPHKTHEEDWFLMQTRWMLYMEDGDTLNLLPGIPRAWLKGDEGIEIKNAATYFGCVSLRVEPSTESGVIRASIECHSDRPRDNPPAAHLPQGPNPSNRRRI